MYVKKSFEFVLFCLFHLKMRRNFPKAAFFHFWTKAMLLLK